MDRELEEQIDELIQKTIKDLKLKMVRIVLKNQNKLLKEQARELKAGPTAPRKSNGDGKKSSTTKESSTKKSSSSNKKGNDSDSDRYYSD